VSCLNAAHWTGILDGSGFQEIESFRLGDTKPHSAFELPTLLPTPNHNFVGSIEDNRAFSKMGSDSESHDIIQTTLNSQPGFGLILRDVYKPSHGLLIVRVLPNLSQ